MAVLMPLLALLGCVGDPGEGDCELTLTLENGGPTTLVHGPQGGWHVDVAGQVGNSSGEVAVTPVLQVGSATLTGEQRPTSHALVDGSFAGVRAFLTELGPDPQAYVCTLDGQPLELEVAVEDLASGCSASAVASGTVALDAVDVPVCDGSVTTETGTTDTGTSPGASDPTLRAIHAAPGLPGQDMLGNGNPGNPPLDDLRFGEAWPDDGTVERPARTYTFEFFDHGSPKPWTLLDGTLSVDSHYSLIVHGTRDGVGPSPGVLFVQDDLDVPANRVRIRWTHAATTLAGQSLTVRDAVTGASYAQGARFEYSESLAFDEAPAEITVWLDLDADGSCDPGEAFEPFERAGGDFFHVLIVNDEAGELFLLGHTLTGSTPTRAQTACP